MPTFGFHLRPGRLRGRVVTPLRGSPGHWGHRLEPPRIAPGAFPSSFRFLFNPEGARRPRRPAGRPLAGSGRGRAPQIRSPVSAALVCRTARLSSEVHRRWARRDPSDRTLSPGKPVPARRGHGKIEPGTCAAWEANSGTWRYLSDDHTLQGPSCLHRRWGQREKRAWRERKGSGKKLVTEEAIFILRYSCAHFSDQLGSKN